MLKLFESWRKYSQEEEWKEDARKSVDSETLKLIKHYVEPLPIKAIYLYGSSALSPDEREEQDRDKRGRSLAFDERDKDIWVQLDMEYDLDLMDEIHDNWESSSEFDSLQNMTPIYDVKLAAKDEAVDEPHILLTTELL